MNGQRRIVSNAMVAVLNVVVGSVILFLLYRFLLRTLGAEAVGAWSLIVASVSAAKLSELGVAASATRFVAAALARNDASEASNTIETAVITLLVFGALAALLAGWIAPPLLAHVVPPEQLPGSLRALPWALAGLVAGLVGGALLSALDGCQRVDLRVWASLGGQVLFLVATFLWAPRYGLAGIAAAQLLQACATLVAAWVLLGRQLDALPRLPLRWRLATFRRIWSYSALFQLNNLLVLVLDPVIKFMISRLGGLEATAYFDMATQLIQRLRQLIVAASQVLVPAVAEAHETGPEQVRLLYAGSYRVVFAATVPFFCVLAALIPPISALWIGREEPLFVGIAWICIGGLALNTIGTPSYFSNLGTGAVVSNTVGHAINLLLALLLGWLGGLAAGPYGVSAGYVTALAAGGLFIQLEFMRRMSLPWSTLVPRESRRLLVACLLGTIACRIVDHLAMRDALLATADIGQQLLRVASLLLLFAVATGGAIWSHPLRRTFGTLRARLL